MVGGVSTCLFRSSWWSLVAQFDFKMIRSLEMTGSSLCEARIKRCATDWAWIKCCGEDVYSVAGFCRSSTPDSTNLLMRFKISCFSNYCNDFKFKFISYPWISDDVKIILRLKPLVIQLSLLMISVYVVILCCYIPKNSNFSELIHLLEVWFVQMQPFQALAYCPRLSSVNKVTAGPGMLLWNVANP